MKEIDHVPLQPKERRALEALRHLRFASFRIEARVLFGSAARGEADEESDLDVLVLTSRPLTRRERHLITDAIFEINLRHDTNLSALVVDVANWKEGAVSVLPIRREVEQDGVLL